MELKFTMKCGFLEFILTKKIGGWELNVIARKSTIIREITHFLNLKK